MDTYRDGCYIYIYIYIYPSLFLCAAPFHARYSRHHHHRIRNYYISWLGDGLPDESHHHHPSPSSRPCSMCMDCLSRVLGAQWQKRTRPSIKLNHRSTGLHITAAVVRRTNVARANKNQLAKRQQKPETCFRKSILNEDYSPRLRLIYIYIFIYTYSFNTRLYLLMTAKILQSGNILLYRTS